MDKIARKRFIDETLKKGDIDRSFQTEIVSWKQALKQIWTKLEEPYKCICLILWYIRQFAPFNTLGAGVLH